MATSFYVLLFSSVILHDLRKGDCDKHDNTSDTFSKCRYLFNDQSGSDHCEDRL